jgi:desulfoferrodoxin (superoxide reductase-like protein)
MDEHSADIDLKYIDRGSLPTAILSLNLRDYNPENVKVFAKCNLHDLWTVPLVAKEE